MRSRPVVQADRRPSVTADAVAVAVGGAAGAVLRHGVAVVLGDHEAPLLWATLLVNVVGCLTMGVLLGVFDESGTPHRWFRPFLVVGVLGGFTTFSTFVVDVLRLVAAGRAGTALGYTLIVVLGSLAAVLGGFLAARTLSRRSGDRA